MKLKPFFSYYGGKWRAAKHYPAPTYDTIVEPFAGAAGYATNYYQRNVVLVEKNPKIAAVWRYLVRASAAEILRIPLIAPGQMVADVATECEEQQWLIGLALNPGGSAPKASRGKDWTGADYSTKNKMNSWTYAFRERVAGQVDHIRHWRVIEGDYTAAPDIQATWFIDPPYAGTPGRCYPNGSQALDFAALAHFCRSRSGQTIVCEAHGAEWLPFQPLGARVKCTPTKNHGGRKHSAEAIWVNEATTARAVYNSNNGEQHMAAVRIGGAKAATKAPAKPAKPRVSSFAQAVSEAGDSSDKTPLFPEPGTYLVPFKGLSIKPQNDGSTHEWMQATFELDGEEVAQLFCISGTSRKRSAERVKQLCMALVGVPTVADFNAFDPHGEFVDCLLGFAESFEGTVGDEKVTITPSEYVGTTIEVIIRKGNDTKDGDWYREPTFKPAPESEGETAEAGE